MEDVRQILVVSRSTESCKRAFHYGVSLAKTYRANLSILHIEYDPFLHWGGFVVPRLADFENEYRSMMEKTRSDIADMIRSEKAEGLRIKEIVKEGEPVHEIMKAVADEKTDLLIMAAQDESRIEHMVYGRFNHEVVRKLPCSVFLVKGE
jgi:nucleotide-binding universal stress UspA family protein